MSQTMTTLVIVESPAKAKTIHKYLGSEYSVKSSVGHIRDLPKSNKNAIDIEHGFTPNYEIVPGKEKIVRELKSACKKADEVILATDPDREGEAIAWHIAEICNLAHSKQLPQRIVFHEITKSAIQNAIEHPREIDMNLKRAQEARRVLDRLFGYDLSGLIWKKLRYGLSAGRVQSPALRILMEREREIRAFKPEDYWVITADTKIPSAQETLALICVEEPRDEKEAERIVTVGKDGSWYVKKVEEREQKRAPRAPFITSTLQQTASSRLGFAPSNTMRLAQSLYEEGHITYMRTDSTNMAREAMANILAFVKKYYGDEYVKARVYKTKSKAAQEAHEAVRPTDITKENAGRTDAHKKLYELIRQRTLASQMEDAKMLKTKITANVKDDEIPDFAANGSRMLFPGWLRADPQARGEDVELPHVTEASPLTLQEITSEKLQTQPPKRYSEAGLIKELEKRGIGRPSTYASTMKTLIDRGYVNREARTLYPTDLGDVVNLFLENNFEKYISDSFTAEMENELDEIAAGKRGYEETLSDFYGPFHKAIDAKQDIEKLTDLGPAPKELECPECGASMVVKLGRLGKFYSCSRFPECHGARTLDGEIMKKEEPKETGEKCPTCDKPLVKRHGRYGEFVGCSGYPKCKYIKQTDGDKQTPVNTTGVKCPKCGKGELAERKGRFGVFYACSAYPGCRFSIKAKPTGRVCPECGSLMMLGTKTIPERCSNKECPNHKPHKK